MTRRSFIKFLAVASFVPKIILDVFKPEPEYMTATKLLENRKVALSELASRLSKINGVNVEKIASMLNEKNLMLEEIEG